MEYQKYLNAKNELYDSILQFIEDESNDESYFHQLIFMICENQKIPENHEEMILFLRLLVRISNNHHRKPDFNNKIEKILKYLLKDIKQTFTNLEIFKICKSSKLIVLFFIENEVITVDEDIAKLILYRSLKTNSKYHYFFYPEIQKFLDEQEIENIEQEINLSDFERNRKIGENEKYICELVRNDSVEEFITLVNRNGSLLKATITPSIFETNSFLIKNEASLIEYAAFYGSIQILQYLKMNETEMKSSLWLYAIHSNNPEMIHLLENEQIKPPDKYYSSCLAESIKCHHNNIANYLKSFIQNDSICDLKPIFQNYNFNQMPTDFENNNSVFYYLYRYCYTNLVDIYLQPKRSKADAIIILKNNNFFYS